VLRYRINCCLLFFSRIRFLFLLIVQKFHSVSTRRYEMNSQAKFSVSFSLQQTVFAVFLCLELQRMKFFPVEGCGNFVVASCAFVFLFHTEQTVELDKPNKKNDDTCKQEASHKLWLTSCSFAMRFLVNKSDDHFSSTSWQKLATCKLDMRAFGSVIE
jgi:hypothetical protein